MKNLNIIIFENVQREALWEKTGKMTIKGYYGILLDVNLSNGQIRRLQVPQHDLQLFLGGRGLAMKILWDRLKPGTDPLSPENLLMFMPGPFSGLPIPSASRTTVVCKSPRTSPLNSPFAHASTISYSSMGGFIGPEIRFSGYDGIVIHGKAPGPVYLYIRDEVVEIRDASGFWGMQTDVFDKKFIEHLGDRRFRSCYIGPAGENLNPMACVINATARAAGRGGTGCVMGSKNLKAIAVRGTGLPNVAREKEFLQLLEKAQKSFARNTSEDQSQNVEAKMDTLQATFNGEVQLIRNFQEERPEPANQLNPQQKPGQVRKREYSCFCCKLPCKKNGISKDAKTSLISYGLKNKTGSMLGANLMIWDPVLLNRIIHLLDLYGLDIISSGNAIGFLMEAYERGLIDLDFLEGLDLGWGNSQAILQMLHRMGRMQGIGAFASKGVKYMAQQIGQGSEAFAVHIKGHELAAWNGTDSTGRLGLSYATCNRGACHMHGENPWQQDMLALRDSIGACSFASNWYKGDLAYHHFMAAITGLQWDSEEFLKAGERIICLERLFNQREGFTRADDWLPERFFAPAPGQAEGAEAKREKFAQQLEDYYRLRGWDPLLASPTWEKLAELGIESLVTEKHQNKKNGL